ncbi:MAG: phosphatase [Opitutales bacterium]
MSSSEHQSSNSVVSVVDVGSNTIKLLVATVDSNGKLIVLHEQSDPTRIGTGIGSDLLVLGEPDMAAAVGAIQRLLKQAAPHQPDHIHLVATGAVRDASNGNEFAERVRITTGHDLVILSGEEEASGIAAGLATDPALAGKPDFLACDLGGGSLELILVEDRTVHAKTSLPLGAIRLAERFISEVKSSVPSEEIDAIELHIRETMVASNFPFPSIVNDLVVTGGSFVAVRAILAERDGIPFCDKSLVSQPEIAELLIGITQLTLPQRIERFPALPPNRADVMPAAMACILALLDYLDANKVYNSLHNLRYGEAVRLLGIVLD